MFNFSGVCIVGVLFFVLVAVVFGGAGKPRWKLLYKEVNGIGGYGVALGLSKVVADKFDEFGRGWAVCAVGISGMAFPVAQVGVSGVVFGPLHYCGAQAVG